MSLLFGAAESTHGNGGAGQLHASSQQQEPGPAVVLEDRMAPDGAGPARPDPNSPDAPDAAEHEQQPLLSPQVRDFC